MRHQPFGIGGITGKTAADVVVNAALKHFVEAQESLRKSLITIPSLLPTRRIASTGVHFLIKGILQEEIDDKRLRKLGRTAKATPFFVGCLYDRSESLVYLFFGNCTPGDCVAKRIGDLEVFGQVFGLAVDLFPFFPEGS